MPVKSKVKISQNFVAFSEYMNFKFYIHQPHFGLHNFIVLSIVLNMATKNGFENLLAFSDILRLWSQEHENT